MKPVSACFFTAIILTMSNIYAIEGKGPCGPKREAKHLARQALQGCLDNWAHDVDPDSTNPTDDCSAKLSTFVSHAKDLKACRVEIKGKHEKK